MINSFVDIVLVDSGERAVQMLESIQFDVVLSDIHMPGMDGFQLIQKAKQINEEIAIFSKLFFKMNI